ncbi:hypothetical protein ACFE04_018010 [Oxalis oulophora]
MAEWSTLPGDLLYVIGKRLKSRWEAIRFRSVSSSWRSSTPPIHCGFPIGFPVYITGFKHIHSFRLSWRTIFLIGLPENRGQWLVKAKEDANGKLHLINPFSLSQFAIVSKHFPNKLNLSDFRVLELSHQIVVEYDFHSKPQTGSRPAIGTWTTPLLWLSGENNNDFALLMTYFHGKLFVYRSKDKSCIEVENKPNKDCLAAASFHGKFYAIDDLGKTLVIEPSRKSEFLPHDVSPKAIRRFLVTSGNELFLIDMFMVSESRTGYYDKKFVQACIDGSKDFVKFQVHKLDEERKQWIELKTLEDRVLFIGKYGSFFAPKSEFSSDHKGNCIIFREDIIYSTYQECNNLDGGPMHLFSLEDSSVKSLTSCASFTNLLYTPPNWIFNFA